MNLNSKMHFLINLIEFININSNIFFIKNLLILIFYNNSINLLNIIIKTFDFKLNEIYLLRILFSIKYIINLLIFFIIN